ncbi:MAG: amidohydrolase family protein, partial [Pseudonocardiaceae bacterium]
TLDNAQAVFQGHRRGSIEVGKLADLVMISGDLLSCPTREIPDITVLMTLVGGAIVHEG